MAPRDLLHPIDSHQQLLAPVKAAISVGDALNVLRRLPDDIYDCCVTSPPYYFVRDYDHKDQLGLEASPVTFVENITAVFHEVKRVLKPTGTLWLNIGDNYCTRRAIRADGKRTVAKGGEMRSWAESAKAGRTISGTQFKHLQIKEKDLFLTPHDVARSLRSDGWYLRGTFHWMKTITVPEKERDAPTDSVEYVFLLSKQPSGYVYNRDVLREAGSDGNGRPHRNVWEISPSTYKSQHTATMPEELAARCILTGSDAGGLVLDPFGGMGTTSIVASDYGRHSHMIELNPDFATAAAARISDRNPVAEVDIMLPILESA